MQQMERSPGDRRRRGWLAGGMLVAVAALLFTAIGAGTASAATLTTDDFEDGNASGWTTTGGTWVVTREDSRVLRQSSLAVSALARTGQLSWRDYTVSADVRPDSFNGMPGFAGVVARAQSTTIYYALVVRPDDSIALIRTIGTTSTTLAERDFEVSEDTTYALKLKVSGNTLTGTVDGKRLRATDGFITNGGPAGLVTKYGTASFDNFTVAD